MKTFRSFIGSTILVSLLWLAPSGYMQVMAQPHAGFKGKYFSVGVNTLVSTFPGTALGLVYAIGNEHPLLPEINPTLELEVAVMKRISVGFHATRRTLGVPYRHDIIWYSQPDPYNPSVGEPVPAGAFPYKWTRLGVDILIYSSGFHAPYGRYFKFSLTNSRVTLDDPDSYLEPFSRNITLTEDFSVLIPSIGFGRKWLLTQNVWLGVGGHYSPDLERVRARYYNMMYEITGNSDFSKGNLYYGKESHAWGHINYGVSADSENSVDMRILMHQILKLNLNLSVGILF